MWGAVWEDILHNIKASERRHSIKIEIDIISYKIRKLIVPEGQNHLEIKYLAQHTFCSTFSIDRIRFIMALSEGTCICLIIGMICLSFVLKNILKLRISKVEKQAAGATKQLVPASPSVTGEPPVDSEKQREILEAQLEALHRDEWCRKFEEEEIKEHARQRMYNYTVQKREMMLEDAKDYLMELRARRMELQRRLFWRSSIWKQGNGMQFLHFSRLQVPGSSAQHRNECKRK